MRPIFFVSACGLALAALSACGPSTPPTARVALDCPSEEGDLKLKSAAPDKKTCDYLSEDGDQVQLRLIPVTTTYEAALQPVEQELQSEQTDQATTAADAKAGAESADAKGANASAIAKAGSDGASAAAAAQKQAAFDALHDAHEDAERNGGQLSIGTNGVTVQDGEGHGDHADINLPGIHISADDDKANVNMGAVHVDAGEDGATVRVSREVRLRGEAFTRARHGFRATYILAKDNLKDGWKAVGYEAAGPKIGPVTVAVFKARGRHHSVSDDVKRLVRHNGGI
ncbi:hypothetical protein [Phenylobacterium sp.]|jgi:hypothetical protein|uniref:hypothetical protein n=1 Tax=Phenylobacterium sp. TaxID=1871053 RepID=UPI002F3FE82F